MPERTQIIVLDDSPAIVEALEMMIEMEGLKVSKFYKGSEMLSTLHPSTKPDVILMDMWLSGEDGRDICRHIKSQEELRDIPVIIMSASRGLADSALEAGADEFVAKPFDMDDIIGKLRFYVR